MSSYTRALLPGFSRPSRRPSPCGPQHPQGHRRLRDRGGDRRASVPKAVEAQAGRDACGLGLRPNRDRGALASQPGARRRDVRPADVGLRDGARASLRQPGGAPAPSADRLSDPGRPPDRRRRAPDHPPAEGARQPGRAERARPRPHGRPLGVVPRSAPDRRLHPHSRRRAAGRRAAVPARGAPDVGHLRPRVRRRTGRCPPRRRGGRPRTAISRSPFAG